MQYIKIFLASSEELKADRVAFELMLGQLNQDWVQRDIFFRLVVWENFIDAMSKDGLQQEYNKAIRDCDIFVLLFYTKVGRYTAEEFETAFGAFQAGNKPLIYTYFKDDVILTGDITDSILSLLEFKKKLGELNHYYTRYRSIEELKWLFSRQLDKLYGESQALSMEITPATTQFQINTIALALVNRYLFDSDARTTINEQHMIEAIRRAEVMPRYTIFTLAQQARKNTWWEDKPRMERVIPIFQALIEADPLPYYYYGQLGYALKDRQKPDWPGAKEKFDHALDLSGEEAEAAPMYHFNRAICLINLDANYQAGAPSDPSSKKAILKDLRAGVAAFGDIESRLNDPWNYDLRKWLQLNGSPRLE